MDNLEPLIKALIWVESGGNDYAIGDTHLADKAYGPLQIREPVCIDVNRKYGTDHLAQDCLGNRLLSEDICRKYLGMYANPYLLRRPVTDEDRARIWNGGPNGYKKWSTQLYWWRVKRYLRQ